MQGAGLLSAPLPTPLQFCGEGWFFGEASGAGTLRSAPDAQTTWAVGVSVCVCGGLRTECGHNAAWAASTAQALGRCEGVVGRGGACTRATGFVLCAGVIAAQGLPVAARVLISRTNSSPAGGMWAESSLHDHMYAVSAKKRYKEAWCVVCAWSIIIVSRCACWWEVVHSLVLVRPLCSLLSTSRQEVWWHGAWFAMLMQQTFWQRRGVPAVLQDGPRSCWVRAVGFPGRCM